MATLTRPGKEGSATTYQGKVAAGYTKILASEVDADLDTLYNAFNGGVDTVNISDGAITTPKLADNSVTSAKILDGTIATADLANGAVTLAKLDPALQVPVGGAFTGDITAGGGDLWLTPRGGIGANAGSLDVRANTTSTPSFDNSKPAWFVRSDYVGDAFGVFRAPPPGTAFVTLLQVDSAGNLTLAGKINGFYLVDTSVTRAKLAINAANGIGVSASTPANFSLSTAGSWAQVVALPVLATRGGWVHLLANHGLAIFAPGGGAICQQRWVRDSVTVVSSLSFNVGLPPGGYVVPFPGIHCIDGNAAAGNHTYSYEVQVATGGVISGTSTGNSLFQALEIG